MKRLLLFVAALGCCLSGCIYTNRYNPGGSQTFLWVPGVAEWKINDNMPSEKFYEAIGHPYEREPHADSAPVADSN